jgi:phosphate transport system permease protein
MTTAQVPLKSAPVARDPRGDNGVKLTWTQYSMPILVMVAALAIAWGFAFLPWINFEGITITQMLDVGLLTEPRVRTSLFVLLLIPFGAIMAARASLRMARMLHFGIQINGGVKIAAWSVIVALVYFLLFAGQYSRSLLDALELLGFGFWVCLLAALALFFREGILRFIGLMPENLVPRLDTLDRDAADIETAAALKDDAAFRRGLQARNLRGGIWGALFLGANIFALVMLALLFINIINQTAGYVVYQYVTNPKTISDKPLNELTEAELVNAIGTNLSAGRARVLVRDNLLGKNIDAAKISGATALTVGELMGSRPYPPELKDVQFTKLTPPQSAAILDANLNRDQLLRIVTRDVLQPKAVLSWPLFYSLTQQGAIREEAARKFPEGDLQFRSWLSLELLTNDLTAEPATTGLRIALVGSLWIIILTILIALPLGVGASVYLEEYAAKNRINAIIETNIRNLAGVPSIIYGMLGLAVFARTLEVLTSGRFVGITDSNGRTIISAAFTMALLILPVVIINGQEAIRAVPYSIREASYGVGATKWQTTWRQVLPAAIPGILTGLILSISRAIGETAPLLVVGGLTFMTIDPNGPFSKFSVVPIQIYSWTGDSNQQFKNVAAGSIIVLLALLLTLNLIAITIRQRFSRKLRG